MSGANPDNSGQVDRAGENLKASQEQFGANAANYASSTVHAKGHSLGLLVESVRPQAHWRALDIATAAGHTALAFAPHVETVVATDVTPQMLEVAQEMAARRGVTNLSTQLADAHELGFDHEQFDLVTCRIAPHHFTDPKKFVSEVARVLKRGGAFGLVDNISPEDPATAKWCDDFERRRDRSHLRCLPMSEWLDLLDSNGLEVRSAQTIGKSMDFVAWCDNMSVPDDVRSELLADLGDAPASAKEWLQPTFGTDAGGTNPDDPAAGVAFVLTEAIIVAHKR